MDIGAVFLILTVALLAALFISRPFLAGQAAVETQDLASLPSHTGLLAEYDHNLSVLQELDFDQTLGKIPEGDYLPQRQALLQASADLLRRLDSIRVEPQDISSPPQAQNIVSLPPSTAEDRIEAAIAARRSQPADNLEAMIAARRHTNQEKSNGFCPRCGKPVHKSDRFCPKCGKAL